MGQKVNGYLEYLMTTEQYHKEWDYYREAESAEFIADGAAEFIAEARDLIIR